MNSNKQALTQTTNLIGENKFRNFLKLQTAYGFAQRGGVQYPFINTQHATRLVASVNILSSSENKNIVYTETIFSN